MENLRINQDKMLRYSFCWTNSTISRVLTAMDHNFHLNYRKIKIHWILRKIVKTSLLKIKLRSKMRVTVLTRQIYQIWVQLETLTRKMVFKIKRGSVSQWNHSTLILWTPCKTINSLKIQIKMCTQKQNNLWKETKCSKTTCKRIFRAYRLFNITSESKRKINYQRTKIKWR